MNIVYFFLLFCITECFGSEKSIPDRVSDLVKSIYEIPLQNAVVGKDKVFYRFTQEDLCEIDDNYSKETIVFPSYDENQSSEELDYLNKILKQYRSYLFGSLRKDLNFNKDYIVNGLPKDSESRFYSICNSLNLNFLIEEQFAFEEKESHYVSLLACDMLVASSYGTMYGTEPSQKDVVFNFLRTHQKNVAQEKLDLVLEVMMRASLIKMMIEAMDPTVPSEVFYQSRKQCKDISQFALKNRQFAKKYHNKMKIMYQQMVNFLKSRFEFLKEESYTGKLDSMSRREIRYQIDSKISKIEEMTSEIFPQSYFWLRAIVAILGTYFLIKKNPYLFQNIPFGDFLLRNILSSKIKKQIPMNKSGR